MFSLPENYLDATSKNNLLKIFRKLLTRSPTRLSNRTPMIQKSANGKMVALLYGVLTHSEHRPVASDDPKKSVDGKMGTNAMSVTVLGLKPSMMTLQKSDLGTESHHSTVQQKLCCGDVAGFCLVLSRAVIVSTVFVGLHLSTVQQLLCFGDDAGFCPVLSRAVIISAVFVGIHVLWHPDSWSWNFANSFSTLSR